MIAQLEIENVDETIDTVLIDADQKSTAANEFEAKLSVALSVRSAPYDRLPTFIKSSWRA